MRRRPLVFFSLSLMAGILVAYYSASYLFILSTILLMASFIISFLGKSCFQVCISVGILMFYSLGAFEFMLVKNLNEERFRDFAGENVEITGFIASEPEINGLKVQYVIKVAEIAANGKTKRVPGRILITTLKDDSGMYFYDYGRRVVINGRLDIPSSARNPGGFDYRLYLAQHGVSATVFARVEDIKVFGESSGIFIRSIGLAIRKRIVEVINSSLPSQQAGLLSGILIGYREGLSKEVQDVFSDSGLSHVMAVSGANVAFLVAPLAFLFKKLYIRRAVANTAIICVLVFFVFITGFEPSVVRAVIMAIVMLLGQIARRETDIFTSIAFASLLLLIYNPFNLFNIGFQLSFAATLSLVFFYKTIRRMISFRFLPAMLADAASVTLAAQVGVLPITAMYFNKISLVSILSNLVVVPLIEVITVLGAIMAVIGQFSIFISRLIGYINCAFLSFVLYVSKTVAYLPFATVRTTTPSVLAVILYYLAAWFLLWYKPMHNIRLRLKHCIIPVISYMIILCLGTLLPAKLEMVFIDVGEGDSIFIKTYRGKTILVDGGGDSNGAWKGTNIGDSTVVPFLLDWGVSKLDMVIVTHAHSDHVGGLLPVILNFKVGGIVIPGSIMPDSSKKGMADIGYKEYNEGEDAFEKLVQAAKTRNIKIHECYRGDVIRLDSQTGFHVLHPKKGHPIEKSSLNNNSLVLKLYYKDVTVLLTGDIEEEAEQLLLGDGVKLCADILKVAHHGSDTSTTGEFLEGVKPNAAIISTGRNKFGHPSAKVVERITSRGINLFRTDRDGGLILKTNGRKIALKKTINE